MSRDLETGPIALDAYEALAERYAARVDTKPHNAYYDRPATLSLLPDDLRGLLILDAGCGPGAYAEGLVDRGATVVGFDASEAMVRLARRRLGGRATFHRADLEGRLGFAGGGEFDVVLSALALNYVSDWGPVFGEFRRVLRTGGLLVASIQHPFADFARRGDGNYFAVERDACVFAGFGAPHVTVPFYRRPIGEVINPLIRSGFDLEAILEPTPTEEFRLADPEEHAELSRRPGFLCLRARRRAGD